MPTHEPMRQIGQTNETPSNVNPTIRCAIAVKTTVGKLHSACRYCAIMDFCETCKPNLHIGAQGNVASARPL